jgi:hypothetical protein
LREVVGEHQFSSEISGADRTLPRASSAKPEQRVGLSIDHIGYFHCQALLNTRQALLGRAAIRPKLVAFHESRAELHEIRVPAHDAECFALAAAEADVYLKWEHELFRSPLDAVIWPDFDNTERCSQRMDFFIAGPLRGNQHG